MLLVASLAGLGLGVVYLLRSKDMSGKLLSALLVIVGISGVVLALLLNAGVLP